jgi:4'-phosphopantetheinyl transferase
MHTAVTRSPDPAAAVLLLALDAGQAPTHTLVDLPALLPRLEDHAQVRADAPPAAIVATLPRPEDFDAALPYLDQAEAARTAQLRDAGMRRAYAIGHAALRLLLAREIGQAPGAVRFAAGAFGKPRCTAPDAPHFNLSRRPGYVAIALASAPVGIDVERSRDGLDMAAIAQRFFTANERMFVDAGPPARRRVRFFSIWARKEALLKAAGLGIDHLERADALKSTVALVNESGATGSYRLHQLASPADCSLALAIEVPPGFPE